MVTLVEDLNDDGKYCNVEDVDAEETFVTFYDAGNFCDKGNV